MYQIILYFYILLYFLFILEKRIVKVVLNLIFCIKKIKDFLLKKRAELIYDYLYSIFISQCYSKKKHEKNVLCNNIN